MRTKLFILLLFTSSVIGKPSVPRRNGRNRSGGVRSGGPQDGGVRRRSKHGTDRHDKPYSNSFYEYGADLLFRSPTPEIIPEVWEPTPSPLQLCHTIDVDNRFGNGDIIEIEGLLCFSR